MKLFKEVQQLFESGPRRKRDERRLQGESTAPAQLHGSKEVRSRVMLFEFLKDRILE